MNNRKLTLLVADDEKIIADRMCQLFSQNPRLKVLTAYDGIYAIEVAKMQKIDLALLDICMPQMDGLALMREMKTCWPDIRIAFLTGHKKFDYAYQSIEQNFVKYILKTEGEKKIIRTIEEFIEDIDEEETQSSLLREAEEALAEMSPHLLRSNLTQIISGEDVSIMSYLPYSKDAIDPSQEFILALCSLNSYPYPSQRVRMIYQLMGIFQRLVKQRHISFLAPEPYQLCIAFWLPASGENSDLNLPSLFEQVQNLFYNTYKANIALICHEKSITIDLFHECYLNLNQTVMANPDMELLMVSDNKISDVKSEDSFIWQTIALIRQDLFSGRISDFKQHCLNLRICGVREDSRLFRAIWYKVMSMIAEIDAYYNLHFFEGISEPSASFTVLFNLLERTGELCFAQRVRITDVNSRGIIQKTNDFIDNHLDEDLSLAALSGRVYLNRSYFSRLYKQITGMNLSDYINTRKMERAKLMLRHSSEKVGNIAIQLGFVSASYFTVFFKKYEGCSPAEYRESLGAATVETRR